MTRTHRDDPASLHRPNPRRRPHARAQSLAIAAALLLQSGTARAAPDAITLPGDRVYPENVVATANGTLYVSSLAHGGVIRVAPGAAQGKVWIEPGTRGTRGTFGMLLDERAGVLWICSNDLGGMGVQTAGEAKGSSLKALDLKTGQTRSSIALTGERTICNDIARGPDGSLYVTNTLAPQILRLRPGAKRFDVWSKDPLFDAGPDGAGLDGIVVGRDGHLYVNTYSKGELFRVEITSDGTAGKVTRIETSTPLAQPDGMRVMADGSLLVAEGGGKLSRVTIDGDKARVETLREIPGGASGVVQVANTAWVTVGQHGLLFDPAQKGTAPALPFRLVAVPLKRP